MSKLFATAALVGLALPSTVLAHIAFWHPSMYGFNVTMQTFPYDNRPVAPLMHRNFEDWWWHGHMDYPPNDGDVFEWPAGGTANVQVACNKGYTSWWKSSEGETDISVPDGRACGDGSPESVHASSINDVMGCGIAIVDKSDPKDVNPEDFAIFTIKHQCPWFTDNAFSVPAEMPACTGENCLCAWFWIHAPDAGGEQMFMTAFKCKVTNTTPQAKTIMKPQLARRCGYDSINNVPAHPDNCTVGAKQPLYWFQNTGNNMFEGTYSPPFYNDLYGFGDGGQGDIFTNDPGPYFDSNGKLVIPSGSGSGSGSSNPTTTTTQAAVTTTTTSAAGSTTTPANAGTNNAVAAAAKSGHCKRTTVDGRRRKRSQQQHSSSHRQQAEKKARGFVSGLFS